HGESPVIGSTPFAVQSSYQTGGRSAILAEPRASSRSRPDGDARRFYNAGYAGARSSLVPLAQGPAGAGQPRRRGPAVRAHPAERGTPGGRPYAQPGTHPVGPALR